MDKITIDGLTCPYCGSDNVKSYRIDGEEIEFYICICHGICKEPSDHNRLPKRIFIGEGNKQNLGNNPPYQIV